MTDDPALASALAEFARAGAAMVICDYDGVLAPIVEDPELAFPNERSIEALVALAALADTHVGVVSGRSVGALEALCTFPDCIYLVGSHGSEFRDGPGIELDPAQVELLARITDHLSRLAADTEGFTVEHKPSSVAFHYRRADPALAEQVVTAIEAGPATWHDVTVKTGKKVIELTVVHADKGTAVDRLRRRLDAGPVLFVGDDVTDEDAFGVLTDSDVGIKVGPGDTLALHRIGDTDDVAGLLSNLLTLRQSD